METASGDDAILIEMEAGPVQQGRIQQRHVQQRARRGGRQPVPLLLRRRRRQPSPDSVEYGYFDRLHRRIEEDYCVDATRQFYAGYSSGGWMAHQLGCQFPDVLRAQASVTGGLPLAIRDGSKTCVDKPIAAFLIHDFNDQSNIYQGSVAAVNRLLALNGCSGGATMDTAPSAPYTITGVPNTATFSCVQYTGCPAAVPDRLLHVTRPATQRPDPRRRPRLLGVLRQAVARGARIDRGDRTPAAVCPRPRSGRGKGEGPP